MKTSLDNPPVKKTIRVAASLTGITPAPGEPPAAGPPGPSAPLTGVSQIQFCG
jgi:hypothetical protein